LELPELRAVQFVDAFLREPGYKVRGLTRNSSSNDAKALAARGVEVTVADLNVENSLISSFKGANTVYAIANFFELAGTLGRQRKKSTTKP
jgi:uncharacterized protein YbjT (DUF2867 family)